MEGYTLMTKEELEEKCDAISKRANKEIKDLEKQYTYEHSKAKVGDIVTDGEGISILVDDKKWGRGSLSNMPMCVYRGVQLKKNGEPYKDGRRQCLWENRVKKVSHVQR